MILQLAFIFSTGISDISFNNSVEINSTLTANIQASAAIIKTNAEHRTEESLNEDYMRCFTLIKEYQKKLSDEDSQFLLPNDPNYINTNTSESNNFVSNEPYDYYNKDNNNQTTNLIPDVNAYNFQHITPSEFNNSQNDLCVCPQYPTNQKNIVNILEHLILESKFPGDVHLYRYINNRETKINNATEKPIDKENTNENYKKVDNIESFENFIFIKSFADEKNPQTTEIYSTTKNSTNYSNYTKKICCQHLVSNMNNTDNNFAEEILNSNGIPKSSIDENIMTDKDRLEDGVEITADCCIFRTFLYGLLILGPIKYGKKLYHYFKLNTEVENKSEIECIPTTINELLNNLILYIDTRLEDCDSEKKINLSVLQLGINKSKDKLDDNKENFTSKTADEDFLFVLNEFRDNFDKLHEPFILIKDNLECTNFDFPNLVDISNLFTFCKGCKVISVTGHKEESQFPYFQLVLTVLCEIHYVKRKFYIRVHELPHSCKENEITNINERVVIYIEDTITKILEEHCISRVNHCQLKQFIYAVIDTEQYEKYRQDVMNKIFTSIKQKINNLISKILNERSKMGDTSTKSQCDCTCEFQKAFVNKVNEIFDELEQVISEFNSYITEEMYTIGMKADFILEMSNFCMYLIKLTENSNQNPDDSWLNLEIFIDIGNQINTIIGQFIMQSTYCTYDKSNIKKNENHVKIESKDKDESQIKQCGESVDNMNSKCNKNVKVQVDDDIYKNSCTCNECKPILINHYVFCNLNAQGPLNDKNISNFDEPKQSKSEPKPIIYVDEPNNFSPVHQKKNIDIAAKKSKKKVKVPNIPIQTSMNDRKITEEPKIPDTINKIIVDDKLSAESLSENTDGKKKMSTGKKILIISVVIILGLILVLSIIYYFFK